MPSSTRWRIDVASTNGDKAQIAEIEMRGSVGGADQCSDGSASASSVYLSQSTWNAAKAFDDNTSTGWIAATGSNEWIEYTFDEAVEVVEYSIRVGGSLSGESYTPKDFSLSYYDGDSWVQVDSRENQRNWSTSVPRVFPVGVNPARYRVNITNNVAGSGNTGLAELEMMDTVDGSSVCAGGNILYSAAVNPATNAFDGSLTTYWAVSSPTNWIGYEFPNDPPVVEYSINRGNMNASYAPKSWTFEYYDWELEDWVVLDTQTDQIDWGENEERTFSVTWPVSPSASISASPSASPSASISASPSASISASPSMSPSASPSASISASPEAAFSGSVVFGHITNVEEENAEPFTGNWTTTASIEGVGDAEQVVFAPGQTKESLTWELGLGTAKIQMDKYGDQGTGDLIVSYKTGDSIENCDADEWTLYDGNSFLSEGWVKIKVARAA